MQSTGAGRENKNAKMVLITSLQALIITGKVITIHISYIANTHVFENEK